MPRCRLRLLITLCTLRLLTACGPVDDPIVPTTRPEHLIALIAGTYTGSGSDGIYQFEYDLESGVFGAPRLLIEMVNPSFGALSAESSVMYFAEESEEGRLQAFSFDAKAGIARPLVDVSTHGAYPCYLAVSHDQRHLAVANYGSGNVAVFPLDASGAPLNEPEIRQHHGRGPVAGRQVTAHAHWVHWSPDGNTIYAVDLGIDRVIAYPFAPESGQLGAGFTALKSEPGAGPRHLVFHPRENLVYVLNELDNSIDVTRRIEDGRLVLQQRIGTLPPDSAVRSQGGHIAINTGGTRLYSSNRGHNSVVVYEIDARGDLSVLQWISTEGDWPRFFLLLEQYGRLLVANERSGDVVAFTLNGDGTLSQTGQTLTLASPTFLTLIPES